MLTQSWCACCIAMVILLILESAHQLQFRGSSFGIAFLTNSLKEITIFGPIKTQSKDKWGTVSGTFYIKNNTGIDCFLCSCHPLFSNFYFFESIIVKFCPSEINGILKEWRLNTVIPSTSTGWCLAMHVTEWKVWNTRVFRTDMPGSTSTTVMSPPARLLPIPSKIRKAGFVLMWVRKHAIPKMTKIVSLHCSSQMSDFRMSWVAV